MSAKKKTTKKPAKKAAKKSVTKAPRDAKNTAPMELRGSAAIDVPIPYKLAETPPAPPAVATVAANPTPETALVLRTCRGDLTAHGGFKWPRSGPVSCPDWNPRPHCGQCLHGLLWGEGTVGLLDHASPSAKWLVVEVLKSEIVELTDNGDQKVKFPRGTVVYCGARDGAIEMIAARAPATAVVPWVKKTVGDKGILAGGYGAQLAGGNYSKLAGGDGAQLAGGYGAKLAGGYGAQLAGGYGAVLSFQWHDGKRTRLVVAYVGEDGIEPNVFYRLDDAHKPVKCDPQPQRLNLDEMQRTIRASAKPAPAPAAAQEAA